MISRISKLILTTTTALFLMFGLLTSQALALDCSNPQTTQEQLQCGACNGSGTDQSTCDQAPTQSTDSLNNTIHTAINLISIVGGIIAVVMLIVGGIRYVTSSGNDQAIASARNTILYAIIGLVIIALAQVIARFTLHTVTEASNKTSYNYKSDSTGLTQA